MRPPKECQIGPKMAKNGQKRTFWDILVIFWPRIKSKTIFGNGITIQFGWAIRFFDRWPFLAIFGHISGPFWPILGFDQKSVVIRVFFCLWKCLGHFSTQYVCALCWYGPLVGSEEVSIGPKVARNWPKRTFWDISVYFWPMMKSKTIFAWFCLFLAKNGLPPLCSGDPYDGPNRSLVATTGTQVNRETRGSHILPLMAHKQWENDWKWAEKTYYVSPCAHC